MIKILSTFIFVVVFTTSNAQNSELIQGKWIFKEALNKGIDKDGRKSLNEHVINKMTLEFDSDGKFNGSLFGEPANGKWSLSKNSKTLILNTNGQQLEFSILELSQNRLILKLGLGEFLMKRI